MTPGTLQYPSQHSANLFRSTGGSPNDPVQTYVKIGKRSVRCLHTAPGLASSMVVTLAILADEFRTTPRQTGATRIILVAAGGSHGGTGCDNRRDQGSQRGRGKPAGHLPSRKGEAALDRRI